MFVGNRWDHWCEVKADDYTIKKTGKPQAFISAMTRLANQNLADAEPPAWVEFLLLRSGSKCSVLAPWARTRPR